MKINLEDELEIQKLISDIYDGYYYPEQDDLLITFDYVVSLKIIKQAANILKEEPTVLQINTKENESDFIIVGDIHGSLESLISIFKKFGDPSETHYLFLGDYVDRGDNSCEVLILLYAYKVLYPENIYLIRGNHEFMDMNECYGFREECKNRVKVDRNGQILARGAYFFKRAVNSFRHLPLCAILNDKIFCVHGGISDLVKNREELFSIQKVDVDFDEDDVVQSEFLWNDPDENVENYDESPRGLGCIFGKNAVDDFLKSMKFDLIIRAHQNESNGYNWPLGENKYVLTVFSSINYCGFDNDGAIAMLTKDEEIVASKFQLISNGDDKNNKEIIFDEEIINNSLNLNDILNYV